MFRLSTSQWYENGEVGVEEIHKQMCGDVGMTISNSQGLWLGFFSLKHYSTIVGNVGI